MNANMVMDSLNWLMTSFNTMANAMAKEAGEHLKQRMPGFLGLSLEDEDIFVFIRTKMDKDKDIALGEFLNACKDYEQNRFRNVVAGMPTDEKIIVTGSGKTRKETKEIKYTPAITFLNRIASLSQEKGTDEARKLCLSGGVILDNPIHIKALKAWKDGVSWFKIFILDKLGVSSISEITPELFNRKFGSLVESLENNVVNPVLNPVEGYIKTHKKKSLFGRLFTI